MECKAILNSIGLSLDIIGVILLFFFGLNKNISKGGTIHLVIEQTDETEKEQWKFYNWMSILGLVLVVIGFLIQIASNWY